MEDPPTPEKPRKVFFFTATIGFFVGFQAAPNIFELFSLSLINENKNIILLLKTADFTC